MFKGIWVSKWRKAEKDPLGGTLGSLERQVMEVVWQREGQTVREVRDRLTRPIAYTTAMTTLDRLYKKGLVSRVRSGRAFLYSAVATREALEAAVAEGVLTGLLTTRSGGATPILSNLVDAVGRQDDGLDLLDTLEGLVRQARRRIQETQDKDRA